MHIRVLAAVTAFLLWLPSALCQKPCGSTVTGHLDVIPFHDKTFGRDRMLRVWLPPGYDDASNAHHLYPVLYMFDGQWLFDRCLSPWLSEWKIDETLTALIPQHRVEAMIVVGIDNAGRERSNEYELYSNPLGHSATAPSGDRIPAFLDEVLPFVESRYRIAKGREHTAIGGSSFGSLAALTALLRRPDVFGLGLLESTSLQEGNGLVLRDAATIVRGPLRVSIGVGSEELGEKDIAALQIPNADPGFVRMHQMLADSMRHSLINTPEVKFTVTPGGRHTEEFWSERFPDAIEFLFPYR
ncbi:alpha/beta hydrolase [Terriglobus sp. ADX1]|uniref:alpha/beta hydrolase n=1 Tax=Terriglobus sp. ADX1 TaxID=2794063 RepID=UPI002FE56758